MKAIKQLIRFGYEQALSCIFPVIIFASCDNKVYRSAFPVKI